MKTEEYRIGGEIGYQDGCNAAQHPHSELWYCEKHPEHLMNHDGCNGAGILEHARIPLLANQLRLARQEIRETAMHRDDLVRRARAAPQQAEAVPPTHVLVPVAVLQSIAQSSTDQHARGFAAGALAAAKKEAGHE